MAEHHGVVLVALEVLQHDLELSDDLLCVQMVRNLQLQEASRHLGHATIYHRNEGHLDHRGRLIVQQA